MPVDKFGRFSHRAPPRGPRGERGVSGPSGEGFLKTENSDYNINWKQLKNIKEPQDLNDATTKNYVDEKIKQIKEYLKDEIDKIKLLTKEKNV